MTIDTLNKIAENGLDSLWRASWQGSIAIVVVWLICLIFRRVPHAVRNVLWLLVCAKMLLALSPISVGVPVPAKPAVISQVYVASEPPPFASPQPRWGVTRPEPDLPHAPHFNWQFYVCIGWLLGAAACGALSLSAFGRVAIMARRAASPTSLSSQQALADAARQVGLARSPRALVSPEAKDVLTLGFLRPTILLPAALIERLSGDLSVVLAHECIHIRRCDPQLGLIPQLAQIVFFFHPLVWFASREFNFTREAACDQAAMTATQTGPDRYGRLLLAIGAQQDRIRPLCLPGASSHFHLLRRRITMLNRISHFPTFKPTRSLAAALSLTALLCVLPVSLVQGRQVSTASLHTSRVATKSTHARKMTRKTRAVIAKAVPAIANARPTNGLATTVFNLQFSKASEAVANLNRLYKSGGPNIVAEPRTNAVMVRGTKAELAEVTGILMSLDQPSHADSAKPGAYDTRLFRLNYAKSDEVAKILQSTVATRGAVSIALDTRTNTLIAVASPERLKAITDLIEQLDTPTEQYVIRRVNVQYGKAEEIARNMTGSLGHPAGLQDITVDRATNSLVVTGTEDVINHVQQLAKIFDVPSQRSANQPESLTLRVFSLKHGKAAQIAQKVNEAFNDPSKVKASSDDFSNNVIVDLIPSSLDQVRAVIKSLDKS